MSTDDYTPTTATVRQAWYEAPYNGGGGREMSDAEFDRWLAARDAEVAERIAQEADQAWKDGSWALTRGTGDWIRGRIAREAGRA